jgi:hypothetical protein
MWFVLVGDPHQTWQPLQILIPGHRVMHPGVAGVLVQVGHRRLDALLMRHGHGLVANIVSQGA